MNITWFWTSKNFVMSRVQCIDLSFIIHRWIWWIFPVTRANKCDIWRTTCDAPIVSHGKRPTSSWKASRRTEPSIRFNFLIGWTSSKVLPLCKIRWSVFLTGVFFNDLILISFFSPLFCSFADHRVHFLFLFFVNANEHVLTLWNNTDRQAEHFLHLFCFRRSTRKCKSF